MREKASTRRTSNTTAGPVSLEKESNWLINSLAPGRIECSSRSVIFKLIQVIGGWDISYEIALILMSLDLPDDKSTVVQVMAWCRQATSHYLSHCWPRSMSPYGVTKPQWVNCRLKWHHMLTQIWVNTGSGIGLLPDHTKPLPETMVTNDQRGLAASTWGQQHRKCLRYLSLILVVRQSC